MNDRECPALGCPRLIASHLYACRAHWYALPIAVRGRISRAWAAFQADPSPDRLDVLDAAHADAQDILDARAASQ